jgi:hypothetical protein
MFVPGNTICYQQVHTSGPSDECDVKCTHVLGAKATVQAVISLIWVTGVMVV